MQKNLHYNHKLLHKMQCKELNTSKELAIK